MPEIEPDPSAPAGGGMMTSAPITTQSDEDPSNEGYAVGGWAGSEGATIPDLPPDQGGWSQHEETP